MLLCPFILTVKAVGIIEPVPPPCIIFSDFSNWAFIWGFESIIALNCGSFICFSISFILACVAGSFICFSASAILAFVAGSVISIFIDHLMVPSNELWARHVHANNKQAITIGVFIV